MKELLLLSATLFCMAICNAQRIKNNPLKAAKNDATRVDLKAKMKNAKIANGDVKIHAEPGRYVLFASYKNSKVTGFYAIDTKGNKIPATYTAKGASKCIACITIENGLNYCYDIDCDDLPKPKTDAVKTAH